jgi:hypothetical protein
MMMTETETTRFAEHEAPIGSASQGLLHIRGGIAHSAIRTLTDAPSSYRDSGGRLFRARFRGAAPNVSSQHGRVEIDQPWRNWLPFFFGASMDVELASALPWEIEIVGGVSCVSAALSSMRVSRFELAGGADDLRLELGAPDRVVPLIVRGGANEVTIVRPRGVPVRLSISGGAAHIALDEQRFEAVGSGLVLTSAGFGASEARYELEIRGGASEVTVREL